MTRDYLRPRVFNSSLMEPCHLVHGAPQRSGNLWWGNDGGINCSSLAAKFPQPWGSPSGWILQPCVPDGASIWLVLRAWDWASMPPDWTHGLIVRVDPVWDPTYSPTLHHTCICGARVGATALSSCVVPLLPDFTIVLSCFSARIHTVYTLYICSYIVIVKLRKVVCSIFFFFPF